MAHKVDSKTLKQIKQAKRELGQLPRQRAGCLGDPDCLRDISERIAELKDFIRRHER